jgi:predicted nucleic acid-binding protein
MLDNCYKINYSQTITDSVINLRKNNNIKITDAIIAAPAQILNLPLITADKNFARIKDIDCIILDF